MLDAASGRPSVTNGSNGFRFGQSGLGKWNLGLGDTDPALTLHGRHTDAVPVDLRSRRRCARLRDGSN